jgi:GTPase
MTKKTKPDFTHPKLLTPEQQLAAEFKASHFSPDKTYTNLPLVVIAGRPNVGKSTLFNRFMKKKVAITDPTPGVTRDPVAAQTFIHARPISLMDTGGYKLQRNNGTKEAELDELVIERSLQMIAKADLIILLLEAGLFTGEDEELIQKLRPYVDHVIVAINKSEGGRNEQDSWNYAKYGFKKMIFISAEHGDRIPELADEIVSRLDFSRVVEDTAGIPVKIAIMGKPNTGKSTLSNRLTHSDASIVSDYAGTTRDVVEGQFTYKDRNFIVLDTAGIRKKAKVTENVEYYSVNRAIQTLDECDVVLLMIDAREGLTEQDKKICSLAYERGRGIIFVLNKWDTQEQSSKTFKAAEQNIRIMFGQMDYAPVIALSALEGKGIIDLLNTALTLHEQLTHRIDTASLNTALKDWIDQYPPPASKAIHFKIRYMTQTGINPVSFLIFATKPEVVPESYITYLKNRIRTDLGFDKIPVQLEMKASRQSWEKRQR